MEIVIEWGNRRVQLGLLKVSEDSMEMRWVSLHKY